MAVAGEGQERELAELAGLSIGERGEARGAAVGGVCAMGKDLEEGEVWCGVG